MEDLQHLKCHDEFERKLHEKGCEYGRRAVDRMDNLELDYKSELVSVKTGQKLFIETIIPNMRESIRSTETKTDEASKAAVRAEKKAGHIDERIDAFGWRVMVGIILIVLTQIIATWFKINQDSENQKQTVAFLMALSRGVKIQQVTP